MSSEPRSTETIPQWKYEEVESLVGLLSEYDSVGVVGVTGIPSRQLQSMRRSLHGSAVLRMSRNTLLENALLEVGGGVEALTEELQGQIGLVLTNENPFGLYQTLEDTKTPAPISAGEVAPTDISVEPGDTGVDPGPFVGELQQVGADARIQDGSIHILSEDVVCEAGEEVSEQLSSVLSELGVEPKEVGLDLRAVYSEGVRYDPDELDIDVESYRSDVQTAAGRAQNLALDAALPTAVTAPTLLANARGEAKRLGLQAAIVSPDLSEELIGRADAQLRALAAQIDDEEALPEELQGVSEPAPEAETDDSEDEAESDEEEAAVADADADTDDTDDDDGGDAGDGIGAMFG